MPLAESKTPGKFAEQTIFAMMIYEFGETWEENQISAGIDDILSLHTCEKFVFT